MRLTTVIQILTASLIATESNGALRADLLSKHVVDLTDAKFKSLDSIRHLQDTDPEEIPEEPTPVVGTTDTTGTTGTETTTTNTETETEDPEEVPEETTPVVGETDKKKTNFASRINMREVHDNMSKDEKRVMRGRVRNVAILTGIITAVVVSIFWIIVMVVLKKKQNNAGLVTVKDESQLEMKNEDADVTKNPINTSTTPDIVNASLK